MDMLSRRPGTGRRVGALLCCALLFACAKQSLRTGDRELVLKIEQLRAYGLVLPADFDRFETFSRERWFDGSVSIEYEFEAPEALGLPYLYTSAERHLSKRDACLSFAAGNLGAKIGGIELRERNDLFQYGDKSRFGLLEAEDTPTATFSVCAAKTPLSW